MIYKSLVSQTYLVVLAYDHQGVQACDQEMDHLAPLENGVWDQIQDHVLALVPFLVWAHA